MQTAIIEIQYDPHHKLSGKTAYIRQGIKRKALGQEVTILGLVKGKQLYDKDALLIQFGDTIETITRNSLYVEPEN